MLLFTSVMVSVSGSPGAVVVELPKLLRMSLRTIPLEVRMLLVLPLAELEPFGSAMQAAVVLDELPEVSLEPPPQDARKALRHPRPTR
jgi:hypothetical protein